MAQQRGRASDPQDVCRDPNEEHRVATPPGAALRPDVRGRVRHRRATSSRTCSPRTTSGRVLAGLPVRDLRRCAGRGSTSPGSPRHTTPTTGSTALMTMPVDGRCRHHGAGLPADVSPRSSTATTSDNRVMVAGYVVTRIALVGQWLRAAKQDPEHLLGLPHLRHRRHRRASRLDRSPSSCTRRFPVDLRDCGAADRDRDAGPGSWRSSARAAHRGTPHHIAERYGLLTIIALGEGVVGTVGLAVGSAVGAQGWSFDAAFVVRWLGTRPHVRYVVVVLRGAGRPDLLARAPRAVVPGSAMLLRIALFGSDRGDRRGPAHQRRTTSSTHSKLGSVVDGARPVAVPVGAFIAWPSMCCTRLMRADSRRVPRAALGARPAAALGGGRVWLGPRRACRWPTA